MYSQLTFLLTIILCSGGQELNNQFMSGQSIIYRVDQESVATDTMGENTSSVKNRTRVTKEWKVIEIDSNKVATMEMRLLNLAIETTRPNGEVLTFDSERPAGPLKESLSPLVGPIVAKLKIDSLGRVLQVINSKYGKASRFETEPPFLLVLHGQKVIPGQTWNRSYSTFLEPPSGTGEKVELIQKYLTKSIENDLVVIELETVPAKSFSSPSEEAPLLQMMPKGTLLFDLKRGLVRLANLSIDREIKDISGPGSNYRFQSTYRETLVDR